MHGARFLDKFAVKIGIEQQADWYRVTASSLRSEGGSALLKKHNGSLLNLLEVAYPQYEWKQWQFATIPLNYWKDTNNQRKYMDWLSSQLGIHKKEEWYDVSVNILREHHGSALISKYNNSLLSLLRAVYPEEVWLPWRFHQVPQGHWSSTEHQKEYFQHIAKMYGITSPSDWFLRKSTEYKEKGFYSLLQVYYGGSLLKALLTLFPESDWAIWRHMNVPREFWEFPSNQRKYFDWLFEHLGLNDMNDWYHVKMSQVIDTGAGGLLKNIYENSLPKALQRVYPEFEWQFWKFNHSLSDRHQFWEHTQHQKAFFDSLAQELGLNELNGWYNIRAIEVIRRGGAQLLNCYNGSLVNALLNIYPHHNWLIWKFSHVPQRFWEDLSHQRKFMDWLGQQLGVQRMEDWYKVSAVEVIQRGDKGIVSKLYKGSLIACLENIYPEFQWQVWLFANVPGNIWDDVTLQRKFFDWIGEKLEVKELDDWYKVKKQHIAKVTDRLPWLLRQCYGNSLSKALSTIYSEHNWQMWRFSTVPQCYWDKEENVTSYIHWLEHKLNIKELDDWYHVTFDDLRVFKGSYVIRRQGGLFQVLCKVYPQHPWSIQRLSSTAAVTASPSTGTASHSAVTASKSQKQLRRVLNQLFPAVEIQQNYTCSDFVFESLKEMELDIYIPQLSLALEFQGVQHYVQDHLHHSFQSQVHRDHMKQEVLRSKGITLIRVGYWWDRQKESIAATISAVRPDLIPPGSLHNSQPIPPLPPLPGKESENSVGCLFIKMGLGELHAFDSNELHLHYTENWN